MTYVCIRCRTIWHVGTATQEHSGGLCDRCITEYIRQRQRSNGFSDCFRRATEACSQTECNYWQACNRHFIACSRKDESA